MIEIDRKWVGVKPLVGMILTMWVTKLRHVNIFTRTHVDFSEVPIALTALFMQTVQMNWNVRNFTDFNHGMVMTSLSIIMTLFVAGVNYRFCVCLYDGGGAGARGWWWTVAANTSSSWHQVRTLLHYWHHSPLDIWHLTICSNTSVNMWPVINIRHKMIKWKQK